MSPQPSIIAVDSFPWRCQHCGQREVVTTTVKDYPAEVRHEGRLHVFTIAKLQIPVCHACGERVLTEEVDRQVNVALRSHLHLLSPEQIRAAIERIGMSQKEVAHCLGIAEATLSRWLTEAQIQSRSLDNLMRAYFAFPDVRRALCGDLQSAQLGTLDGGMSIPGSAATAGK